MHPDFRFVSFQYSVHPRPALADLHPPAYTPEEGSLHLPSFSVCSIYQPVRTASPMSLNVHIGTEGDCKTPIRGDDNKGGGAKAVR